LELVDLIYFFIDVVEGVSMYSKTLLRLIKKENLPVIFIFNKIDRFIIEQKLT